MRSIENPYFNYNIPQKKQEINKSQESNYKISTTSMDNRETQNTNLSIEAEGRTGQYNLPHQLMSSMLNSYNQNDKFESKNDDYATSSFNCGKVAEALQ
jgi:hypothetical protein